VKVTGDPDGLGLADAVTAIVVGASNAAAGVGAKASADRLQMPKAICRSLDRPIVAISPERTHAIAKRNTEARTKAIDHPPKLPMWRFDDRA
jgi:hypothetical protein